MGQGHHWRLINDSSGVLAAVAYFDDLAEDAVLRGVKIESLIAFAKTCINFE